MNEKRAKKQLAKMLRNLTGGSILYLLADVHRDLAEEARQDGNATAHEQFLLAHGALIVVGHGIDAICPR